MVDGSERLEQPSSSRWAIWLAHCHRRRVTRLANSKEVKPEEYTPMLRDSLDDPWSRMDKLTPASMSSAQQLSPGYRANIKTVTRTTYGSP